MKGDWKLEEKDETWDAEGSLPCPSQESFSKTGEVQRILAIENGGFLPSLY